MSYFKLTLPIVIAVIGLAGCGGAEERKEVYLEKSRLSIEAGDLDKARIELRNVLQIDPKDAQAHFQLGEIYNRQKNYQKAYGEYLRVVEIDPDNLEAHAILGTYYLILMGDIDKAIEKRDFILGKDGSNVDGLLLKAGILFKQNDVTGAKNISQGIFSKQPDYIENAAFLSRLHLRDEEYDDSIKVLNACIKLNSYNRFLKNMLAKTYLNAGKIDQAEIQYKEILGHDSDVFSNYVMLATFYREIGDIDNAEEVLRNAIDADKDDHERKLVLIDFIQKAKGNQDAIDELKKLLTKNSKIGKLRLSLGRLYVAENKYDDAEKTFKLMVSDFFEDSIAISSRVDLANLYMQKKNLDAAKSVIDDALKISPNDSEVNLINAKLLFVSQDYDDVITSLRIVIKEDPEKIEAYILLSAAHNFKGEAEQAEEILNQAYINNRVNPQGLIQLARYYAKNKYDTKLEKVIDNYLSMDPDNYEALSFKSELLSKRKMFSEIKPYASRLLELYPDMPNGYIHSASYMVNENRKNDAINLLDEGFNKVSKNEDILKPLVSLYVSLKDFDVATNKVQSFIRDNGETADLYVLLSKIQMASGNVDSAKVSLNKARKVKPDWNAPYLILANIYTSNKQDQKAIDILRQGLLELKNDLRLSLGLAKIYEDSGDYNNAISEYERAYEKDNNSVILANNLASLLSEYRNDESSLKRAKVLADKLKNIDKPMILDTAGWVYYKVGDYAEAVNILKNVVEKSPEVAVFNYHFGMALYKTGDMVAAKSYLTRSLANNSSFTGKEDAEAHLQKLK